MAALQLGLDVSQAGPVTLVTVRGELDMATAPALDALLDELLTAGASEVAVDFGEVDFVDSNAIDSVIARRELFAAVGGDLRVRRPGRLVRTIFNVLDPERRVALVDIPA